MPEKQIENLKNEREHCNYWFYISDWRDPARVIDLDLACADIEEIKYFSESNLEGVIVKCSNSSLLTPEIAGLLIDLRCLMIYFDNLSELSLEMAEVLAQCSARILDISGLDTITPEAAKALAEFKGDELSVSVDTDPNVDTMEAIATFRGRELRIGGDITITPETARALIGEKGSFNLVFDGIKPLTPEAAEVLSNFKGDRLLFTSEIPVEAAGILAKSEVEMLDFYGFSTLPPETAKVVAGYNGNLTIGAKRVSYEAARELAAFRGSSLGLKGVTELGVETMEELVKFIDGTLFLNDFLKLDAETAKALVKFKGDEIALDKITKLTPETARILATYGGELSLAGLDRISSPVAAALHPIRRRLLNVLPDIEYEIYTTYEDGGDPFGNAGIAYWRPLFKGHPGFKDMVMEESCEQTQYLKESGLSHPERFHNLNASRGAETLIREAMEFMEEACNGMGVPQFMERFAARYGKAFQNTPEFIEVYLDETVQVITEQLQLVIEDTKRKLAGREDTEGGDRRGYLERMANDPNLVEKVRKRFKRDLERLISANSEIQDSALKDRLSRTESILERMNDLIYLRPGKVGYKLASRNRSELALGDQCSDCTSAKIDGGGMNFWTVPTWLTDPGFNFLLQYDENGNLAHKFGVVWFERADMGKQVPVLILDSLELGNSQKDKSGMYQKPADKEREQQLMDHAIEFVHRWAADMGLDPEEIYAQRISNTGTSELAGYEEKTLSITKLGGLDGPASILKKTNPDCTESPAVYLQCCKAGDAIINSKIVQGDRNEDFARAENVFDNFMKSGSPDVAAVRELIAIARTDVTDAARKMRVFLLTGAEESTRSALTIDGRRIDVFLNSRGHSMDAFLKQIYGQVNLTKGVLVRVILLQLSEKADEDAIEEDDDDDEDNFL